MDQRAARTRTSLRDAFVTLATEVPFAEIRVQDILETAGVGRTTFYAHFRDKEDLLVTLFLEMMDRIEAQTDASSPLALPHAQTLFDHFLERKELCTGLRRGDRMDALHRAAEGHVRRFFERKLATAEPGRASLVACFAASAFIALWRWWVAQGRRAPTAEMAATYEALVGPAVGELLESRSRRR